MTVASSTGAPCRAHLETAERLLELHLRRLIERLAVVPEVEEGARREAEHAGEQRRRELLDAGVVFAHRVVEEAARRRELVLDVGQLGLQLLEICVGLEV